MEAADLVVINTCAIREAPRRRSSAGRATSAAQGRQPGDAGRADRLRRARARPRRARRAGIPAVDLFLRPDEEPELVDRLGLASAQGAVGAARRGADRRDDRRRSVRSRTRRTWPARARPRSRTAPSRRGSAISAWLPIIYGCDKTCTYCIVPFSRGPERSRPFDEIVDEARALARRRLPRGHAARPERQLVRPRPRAGGALRARRHRARAGRRLDLHGRPDLAELIRAIDGLRTADGAPAIPRLRFVTSHPWDLSDRLIAAMADCPSVCEALHLPVQSGDDAMLRRMGRQYTIEHYLERLAGIREAVPGIALSTDVIVGFCGETEAQFEATLRLLETVRYDQVFAAAYSERPGTPATQLADDVPAGREAPPAQRAARAPGGDRARAEPGVGRPRRRGPRRHGRPAAQPRPRRRRRAGRRRAEAATRSRTCPRRRPPRRPDPREQARPRGRRPGAARAARRGAHRARRPVRAPGRSPRVNAVPPLLVIAGPTATGKTGLGIELAERCIAEASRPRSSRPTRGRSTAASTSGRPRSTAEERARVVPSRPRPRRARPAVQRRRLPRACARARSRASASAAASALLVGGTGSGCGRSPAGSTPTRCRPTAASAPR